MEISFTINPSQPTTSQKRKCGSKGRTGCATCKVRHIKCDELKPSCSKCISSGRKCPGYDVFVQAKVPQARLVVKPNPTPVLPNASKQERLYFDKFRGYIVDGFCGIFDGTWWSPYLIQAAVAEPMILHAAIAFSAAYKTTADDDIFAIKQYNKAMSGLYATLQKADYRNPNLLLLACLMLACLGFARNETEEAIAHLRGGAAVLSTINSTTTNLEPSILRTADGAESCIVNAFRRLDLATTLSMSTRPFPNWFAQWVSTKSIILDPLELNNVVALRNRLDRWVTEVVCLIQDTQKMGESGTPLYRNILPLKLRVEQMTQASDQWLVAFTHMCNHAIPAIQDMAAREQVQRAADLLRLHHRCGSVMLATSLADGREMLFDDFLDDFKAMVDLATSLAPYFQTRSTVFTLDIGVIPTLYYTVCKCRDPITRHHALNLLSSLAHREGAWDAKITAGSARRIVELEERAARTSSPGALLAEASHMPETARVHEAYLDIESSDTLVYCKRRKFENNGEWKYWQERVE